MPTYLGADGARLHYDVIGDPGAPSVVVLAGGPARHPAYLGDLGGLSERWRLVVPHLRGVGSSPRPDDVERGSSWWQAGDLERLREHLGLDDLVIAGHSAGTRLAVAYAVQQPSHVAGLLLITPPAQGLVGVPSDTDALIARLRPEPEVARALAALDAGPDTTSDAAFNTWQLTAAPAGYARWGPAERAHAEATQYDVAAALAYFSVSPPQDLATRLGRLVAPVLVVAGGADLYVGVAPLQALAAVFPHGRCVALDECGHYPWVEQPTAFRRAVDPFLELVAQPAG